MRLLTLVNRHRVTAAAGLAAAIWCGQLNAHVLEQVPSDATAVLKIKDLEQTNTKVAKMAKTFGLDEFVPELKDPLGSMLEKAKMSKGLNKAGDAALAFYAPDEHHKKGASEEPAAVALVPVSDYAAFVSNFEKADKPAEGDGITAVKDPEDNSKTLYIVHRGEYAAFSDKMDHLGAKAGIKLSAIAAREADAKDLVFLLNMPVVRDKGVAAVKEHRKEMMEEIDKGLEEQANLKPYIPVIDTLVNHALDTAVEFLNDSDAIEFTLNLTDAGIVGTALVEFSPDSKLGKTAAEMKATNVPLLAGLPEGKYFFVGGASLDHKVVASIADEWINPIIKGLNDSNTDTGKKLATTLESAKTAMASADHSAAGMIAPTKPLGAESLFQQVSVIYGDAKALGSAEKGMLTEVNDLMALAPQNKGMKTSIVFGDPKTVDGVELQTYTTKFDFDKNDPQAMQAQQIFAMLYGPTGMSGSLGAVDDKTFVLAQGVSDELLKELIASSKSGKDVLSDSAAVSPTAAQLPAGRSVVYYIYLDNIVTTSLRYAQGFGLTVKLTLPENLPAIGISAGAEGSAIRVDGVIPTKTVQSLISAGLKAYTDMQQAGNKGGGL